MPEPSSELQKAPLPKADKYIWAIYIAILVISVIELYSASSREVTASNVFGPLIRHCEMLGLGMVFTIALSRMHYRWLIPITPIFVLITLLLGFYVLFKGDIINGARRSTTLMGIAIQPAELLKLSVVLIIALVMSKNKLKMGVKTRGVVISAAFVLLCGGLLFSQGLTNTLLLMGISFAMMLIAGVEWKKFGIVLLAYAVMGGGAYMVKNSAKPSYSEAELLHIQETGKNFAGEETTISRDGTQQSRISQWLGNDSVPKYDEVITSKNRQEQYSYMAQANGGIIGQLPGNSRETARLPLAFSDYIFAIVVEDWGAARRPRTACALSVAACPRRCHRLALLAGIPGFARAWNGCADSAAGAVPHGHRNRCVPCVRSAAAAHLQGGARRFWPPQSLSALC